MSKFYKEPSFVPRVGDLLKVKQIQTGVAGEIIVKEKLSKYTVFTLEGRLYDLHYYKTRKVGKYKIKRCKCCKTILSTKKIEGK